MVALLAPVPAVATMVIASVHLAAGNTCATPQPEWVIVQALVLLLHMAFAAYACCSFARPYVGASPPPGLEVAAEQARRNRDETQADRMLYLVCYDPVTAVYILLGGVFGVVWLIMSPVWFGDPATVAGCSAELLTARQWGEGCGIAVLVLSLFCCCFVMLPATGTNFADFVCDLCLGQCIVCCCLAVGCRDVANRQSQRSRDRRIAFHEAITRPVDGQRRPQLQGPGEGAPTPTSGSGGRGGYPAGSASRSAYAGGAAAPKHADGSADGSADWREASDTAELPPHKRRPHHSAPTTFTGVDTTSASASAAPSAPRPSPAPSAPPPPPTPTGPGLPRRGGQRSDMPPHKRAPARAGATAPAEPAAPATSAAADPADPDAGRPATRVGQAFGALVGGVVGFMAPKKPR